MFRKSVKLPKAKKGVRRLKNIPPTGYTNLTGNMDTLNKQKDNCTGLLELIKEAGFDAICAGGFPRDYKLTKDKVNNVIRARDLDIYVKYSNDYRKLILALKEKGFLFEEVQSQYKLCLNRVSKVYAGNFGNGSFDKFEIILVKTAGTLKEYVYDNFDVSICKAIFDGTNFEYSPDFLKTLDTKIITYNGNLDQDLVDYSFRKHMPKIQSKFKKVFKFDFTNIDAPECFIESGYCIKITKIARKLNKDNILAEFKNRLLLESEDDDFLEFFL